MIKKAPEFRRREYIPEFEDTFKFFLGIIAAAISGDSEMHSAVNPAL